MMDPSFVPPTFPLLTFRISLASNDMNYITMVLLHLRHTVCVYFIIYIYRYHTYIKYIITYILLCKAPWCYTNTIWSWWNTECSHCCGELTWMFWMLSSNTSLAAVRMKWTSIPDSVVNTSSSGTLLTRETPKPSSKFTNTCKMNTKKTSEERLLIEAHQKTIVERHTININPQDFECAM